MSNKDKISFEPKQQKLLQELVNTLSKDQAVFLSKFLADNSDSFVKEEVSATAVPIFILYGSESGNAENLAAKAGKIAKSRGFKPIVKDMLATKPEELVSVKNLLVVVSTWGEGDPPERAVEFFKEIKADSAPKVAANFAVLALGDTSYVNFCQAGKDMDKRFEQLGGKRIFDRTDCDVDFEKQAMEWLDKSLNKFLEVNGIDPASIKVSAPKTMDLDKLLGFESPYTQSNPYEAVIKDKVLLNEDGSEKETYHIEIDLAGSGIRYAAGDALGLYAINDAKMVEDILKATGLKGDEVVAGKKLRELLTSEYDINALSKPVLENYAKLTGNAKVKALAESKDIEEYTYGREVIDLLTEFPHKGITAEQLVSVLRKLPHRLYSISSSQDSVGEEVHLTVATVRYESNGRKRKGVASGYIADDSKPNDKVRIFIKQNKNFRLPENNNTPVIMVGPGTGVAPFRAFLQQRDAEGAKGKNWLFFGEQRYLMDFFYQLELQEFKEKGILTNFDAAFSRDRPEKVYVQHKMMDRKKELYEWLEQGAYFYVCGDEKRMAKDVDATLHKVIADASGKGEDFAKTYVNKMKTDKRYLRDVY